MLSSPSTWDFRRGRRRQSGFSCPLRMGGSMRHAAGVPLMRCVRGAPRVSIPLRAEYQVRRTLSRSVHLRSLGGRGVPGQGHPIARQPVRSVNLCGRYPRCSGRSRSPGAGRVAHRLSSRLIEQGRSGVPVVRIGAPVRAVSFYAVDAGATRAAQSCRPPDLIIDRLGGYRNESVTILST